MATIGPSTTSDKARNIWAKVLSGDIQGAIEEASSAVPDEVVTPTKSFLRNTIGDPTEEESGGLVGVVTDLVTDPVGVAKSIPQGSEDQYRKMFDAKTTSEKIGHALAGSVPLFGPGVAGAAEEFEPEFEDEPIMRRILRGGAATVGAVVDPLAAMKLAKGKVDGPSIVPESKPNLYDRLNDPNYKGFVEHVDPESGKVSYRRPDYEPQANLLEEPIDVPEPVQQIDDTTIREMEAIPPVADDAYPNTPLDEVADPAPPLRLQVEPEQSLGESLRRNLEEQREPVAALAEVEPAPINSAEVPALEAPAGPLGEVEAPVTDLAEALPPTPPVQGPSTKKPKKKYPGISFKDFVNHRRAAPVHGERVRQEFQDLPQGLDAILDYQSGKMDPAIASRIQEYTDRMHQELLDSGMKVGKKEKYLHQMWKESPEQVKAALKRVGVQPDFTMKSVLKDFQAGIDAGLTPKFDNIADILSVYETKARKGLAGRKYFNELKNKKLVKPAGKAPKDWVVINMNQFPKARVKTGKKSWDTRPYAVHPSEAVKLQEFLRDPNKGLQTVAELARGSKNLMLTAGVPGTGVNMQGWNTVARTLLAEPKNVPRHIRYILKPSLAVKQAPSLVEVAKAIEDGLMLSAEGFTTSLEGGFSGGTKGFTGITEKTRFSKQLTPVTSKVDAGIAWMEKTFSKPIIDEVMPTIKYRYYEKLKAQFIEEGVDPREAGYKAAETCNTTYGGINAEELARNKDFQNFMQSVFLAPDLLETNLRMGKGMAKSLLDPSTPEGRVYREATRNLAAAYAVASIANKLNSGQWLHENDSGHQLSVAIGKDSNGKMAYWRPFGTASEFANVPLSVAKALISEQDIGKAAKVVKNKTSGVFQTSMNLLFNHNYKGQPLYGKDKYGREQDVTKQVGNVAGEVVDPFTPPFAELPFRFSQGEASLEEALLGSVEAPIQFSHSTDSKKKTTSTAGVFRFSR